MARPPTATVFVGNLPFDTTEAEVHALLAQIGQIKNLRMILDRDTGKPRGFAFCEFHSKDDAESAFRNLNGTMLKTRQLKIDYAQEDMSEHAPFSGKPRGDRDRDRDMMDRGGPPPIGGRGGHQQQQHPSIGMAAAQQSAAQVTSLLGGPPSSDRHIQDMLNELLASKSRAGLWDVMRMLKDYLGGDRNVAKAYLAERPGLTKAVFQAQVLLGMVKPLAPGFAAPPPGFQGGPMGLTALPPGAVPAPTGQPMAQVVIVDPVTGQQTTMMLPADQLGAIGTVQAAPAQPGIVHASGPVSLPGQPVDGGGMILQQQPVQAMPLQQQQQPVLQQQQPQVIQQQPQPQVVQQQPQQPGGVPTGGMFAGQDPQQMQALLRQVMVMSDEQINALPAQYKDQILYVKEQIRLGHVRVD